MNDPRITSYALGELIGREREEFERELAASEELQRALNETIPVADALHGFPMPAETFGDARRSALRRAFAENAAATRRKAKVIKFVTNTGALAASLTVIVGLASLVLTRSVKLEIPSAPLTARVLETDAPSPRVTLLVPPSAPNSDPAPPSSSPLTPAPPMGFAANRIGDDEVGVLLTVAASPAPQLQKQIAELLAANDAQTASSLKNGVVPETPIQAAGETARFVSGNAAMPRPKVGAGQEGGASLASAGTGVRLRGDIPLAGRLFRPGEMAGKDLRTSHSVTSVSGVQATVRLVGESENSERSNTETYDAIEENVFLATKDNPLSTFSIDVDTASYANVRRFLQGGQIPPAGAIRTEELLNYFPYQYPQPEGDAPFSVNLEVSRAPWDSSRALVRIGLKGREIPASERGAANLVFLVDVSGSMQSPDKLPLLQTCLASLVKNLSPKDRVAIVVYAGSSGVVLPSTPGTDKARILGVLENLEAGGSTHGSSGIRLAYTLARENFLKEGSNRVILCTDGDFNVGTTNQSELVSLIEKERLSGVFLSVLGFGSGNLKDSTMEKLADKGNGNYAYIDSPDEGRKVLVEQMGATLFTIAKDVKIQVEFNPARVAGYRLIGYENRLLAREDFNDDKKDAGEIGAGHAVTAFYEVIPAGQPLPNQPSVEPLKYQPAETPNAEHPRESTILKSGQSNVLTGGNRSEEENHRTSHSQIPTPISGELLTVKLRYKEPNGEKSKLIEVPLPAPEIPAFDQATSDFQFAAAVAAFGLKLRGSPTAGDMGWPDIQKIVRGNLGADPGSYRAEFLTLIERAGRLRPADPTADQ